MSNLSQAARIAIDLATHIWYFGKAVLQQWL